MAIILFHLKKARILMIAKSVLETCVIVSRRWLDLRIWNPFYGRILLRENQATWRRYAVEMDSLDAWSIESEAATALSAGIVVTSPQKVGDLRFKPCAAGSGSLEWCRSLALDATNHLILILLLVDWFSRLKKNGPFLLPTTSTMWPHVSFERRL